MQKKWNHRGFTLIELLIVIAIIAIMLAIALPSFSSLLNGAKFRDDARKVASILRLARSSAARDNLEYRVRFEVANRRYLLERGDSVHDSSSWTAAAGGWTTFETGVGMASTTDCDNVTSEKIIHFNPNGSANKLYICVMDGAVEKFKVGVSHSTTGRVRIE